MSACVLEFVVVCLCVMFFVVRVRVCSRLLMCESKCVVVCVCMCWTLFLCECVCVGVCCCLSACVLDFVVV